MIKPNVLQHQYAISMRGERELVLSTKGILICTGWYGWDSANKIVFLCHFDCPKSADSVPNILKDIKQVAPQNHSFKSVLVGGKKWFWSKTTRRRIKECIATQNEVNISVRNGPYDNAPCAHRNLLISSYKGRIKSQNLSGKSCPKGYLWFFGPMQRVEPDA